MVLMMSPSSSTILFSGAFALLVIAACLPFGSAIKCYRCQSLKDPECGKDMPREPTAELMKLTVDCSDGDKQNKSTVETSEADKPYTFCRKQLQSVDGRVNIIRACGLVKGDKPCYNAGVSATSVLSCQCFEDYCNTAPTTISLSLMSLLLPFMTILVFRN